MAEEKKLFGMPAEKGRWILVLLGFIINLCLGSVYAYSIFGTQLAKEWGFGPNAQTKIQAAGDIFKQQIPFGVFLLFFAILFLFSGQLLEKLGPKKQGIIGGIIVALGWILSAVVVKWSHSVPLFVLTYGMIAGAGVGICYIIPIQAATRWFPDKKGLATGLAVAGFGGSPFISTYLGQKLIDMNHHVFDALLYLGIAFLVVILVSAWFMVFPEAGWKPAGWTPKAAPSAATSAVNYNRKDIIKTRAFWVLFACFTIGSLAGLMAIGVYKSVYSMKMISLTISTAALSTAVIVQFILAPFNAGGRPLLGFVTDKLGPKVAAMITFVLILVAAILMITMRGSTTATEAHKVMYFVAFCLFYLGLGGWLAIAPTATAQYFGTKFSGRNYGLLFLAYGVGGIVSTFVAAYSSKIFKGSGGLIDSFIVVAILAVVGLLLAVFLMKAPKTEHAPKE
jgi:OFA family oxalate/formate antiporter-like MFS transporter